MKSMVLNQSNKTELLNVLVKCVCVCVGVVSGNLTQLAKHQSRDLNIALVVVTH